MQNKIIIGLSLLVLGLAGYMFYDSLDSGEMSKAQIQTEFKDLKTDYEVLQRDLENRVARLNVSNKIIDIQKNKIETLLKKNAISEEELFEAKKLMGEISQSVLNEYHKRVYSLQKEKETLITNRQNEENEIKALNAKIKTLESSNRAIATKYETEKLSSLRKDNLLTYASKISISNFVLKGIRVKNSGKEVETDRASRIDRLKMNFDITENKIAESGNKQLYIIVKNPEGNLTTFYGKPTGNFVADGRSLTFSDRVLVKYIKGEEQTVNFEWDGEDFSKGDYVLEVFEQTPAGALRIGKATKTLE